jgi:hypothetical protein
MERKLCYQINVNGIFPTQLLHLFLDFQIVTYSHKSLSHALSLGRFEFVVFLEARNNAEHILMQHNKMSFPRIITDIW